MLEQRTSTMVYIDGARCEACGRDVGPDDVGVPSDAMGRFVPGRGWPILADALALRAGEFVHLDIGMVGRHYPRSLACGRVLFATRPAAEEGE